VTGSAHLQPLSIAEIFDRSVTVAVRRWRTVMLLCALAALPDVVVRLIVHSAAPVFAAMVRSFAFPGAPVQVWRLLRSALPDYWRSLGAFILSYVVIAATLIPGALIVVAVSEVGLLAGGPRGGLIGGALTALVVLALLVPVFTALAVYYPIVILEGIGPWTAIGRAFARFTQGGMRRTWLLGAALLVISVAPYAVLEPLANWLSALPGLWWVVAASPYVEIATGTAYAMAITTVAAIDYRTRSEGSDIEAALDAGAHA
jgi:hypothetical protein